MIKPKEKNSDGKIFSKTEGIELVIVKKENKYIYLVFESKNLIDIEIENIKELPVGTKCVGKVDSVSNLKIKEWINKVVDTVYYQEKMKWIEPLK